MSEFLEASACKGRRPDRVAIRRLVPRPDLIARLLRERHVARFLVAPDGFGKTTLACEYADTVFSFEHVFWVNGRSPCFLRDLDRDIIATRLCSLDPSSFLVVFEDVPRLDSARAERFSRVIDDVLEAGDEVLVTCVPSCDAYAGSHRDRTKLDAADLLLSDAECRLVPPGESQGRAKGPLPPAERVACLRWGSDDGTRLLGGIAREELPGDVMLALFAMLALQEGGWSDLEAFVPSGIEGDLIDLLEDGYPFLGIDRHGERYRTTALGMGIVATAFDGSFDVLASRSLFDGRDALARRIADALIARSAGERACELMAALASKAACAAWLAGRSRTLLKAACLKPAHDLHAFVGRVRGPQRTTLNVAESWRLVALGDEAGASTLARRAAFAADAPEDDRAFALLVVKAHGSAEARRRAGEMLHGLLQAHAAARRTGAAGGDSANALFWTPFASIVLALDEGVAAGLRAWCEAEEAGADPDALALAAALALDAATAEAEGGAPARTGAPEGMRQDGAEALASVARFVHARLEAAEGRAADLFLAAATAALERAGEAGALPRPAALPASGAALARRLEIAVYHQRAAYRRAAEERAERKENYVATHPDAFRDERRGRKGAPAPSTASAPVAPLLRVNLFGGLEVWMGDEPVDPQRFRRQKARTLLALLVLNHGKEITRDRLVRALWPESQLEAARKNFYSIWSQLRRVLATPEGTCPYLIRAQGGCRIDARLLDSDVARFEALCRTLLFGRPEAEDWEPLFAQVSNGFADDLLPGESECDLVVQMREEYRVHLVDALVAAAARLVEAGEVRGGLWFAREALKHDRSREDAYTALMEAQIAAGQRTAALETYFACRRYLTNELGIDPSLRTVQLYRDIIEAEEALDW